MHGRLGSLGSEGVAPCIRGASKPGVELPLVPVMVTGSWEVSTMTYRTYTNSRIAFVVAIALASTAGGALLFPEQARADDCL